MHVNTFEKLCKNYKNVNNWCDHLAGNDLEIAVSGILNDWNFQISISVSSSVFTRNFLKMLRECWQLLCPYFVHFSQDSAILSHNVWWLIFQSCVYSYLIHLFDFCKPVLSYSVSINQQFLPDIMVDGTQLYICVLKFALAVLSLKILLKWTLVFDVSKAAWPFLLFALNWKLLHIGPEPIFYHESINNEQKNVLTFLMQNGVS